jgi:hypothetical protein
MGDFGAFDEIALIEIGLEVAGVRFVVCLLAAGVR